MRTRTYGTFGPLVFTLHGGPAAVGEAEYIARGLSNTFRVVEPFQRGSGDRPLTVAQHVEDLHELIQEMNSPIKPSIIGESWGAMLALAYASAYPDNIAALVLVGCGTFDKASRARMNEIIEARMKDDLGKGLQNLTKDHQDPGDRLKAKYDQIGKYYNYDPETLEQQMQPIAPFDMRAHTETWNDMLELQEKGIYPTAFSTIKSPVLMLHGDYDPHPGQMIHANLLPYIPQIEYHELPNCGHSPWKERLARQEFFLVMSSWLLGKIDEQKEET